MDVIKVDLNVAYVVSVLSGYCSGYTHVAGVCSKYFICFRRMLQEVLSCCKCFMNRRRRSRVRYTNVAKVDMDVAYIAIATHILEVSIQNVLSTLDVYCKCFYLYVVYVAVAYMLQMYVRNIPSASDVYYIKCFHVASVS
jgi:hypothetical protein